MQERVGKEVFNTVQNSDINLEKIAAADQGKGFTRNKNQKVNKASKCGLRLASNGMMGMEKTATLCQSPTCSTKYDATFVSSKSEDDVEVQASVLTDVKHTSSCREYVDLDCSQKNFR